MKVAACFLHHDTMDWVITAEEGSVSARGWVNPWLRSGERVNPAAK